MNEVNARPVNVQRISDQYPAGNAGWKRRSSPRRSPFKLRNGAPTEGCADNGAALLHHQTPPAWWRPLCGSGGSSTQVRSEPSISPQDPSSFRHEGRGCLAAELVARAGPSMPWGCNCKHR